MMNQGVRAAVIAVQADTILLVRHVHPQSGEEWWCPPGGALEGTDASVQDCASREAIEETGLQAEIGRLVYIREFREADRNTRWVELYFLAESLRGSIKGEHRTGMRKAEKYIREAKWIEKEQLPSLPVFPEILKDHFWADYPNGFRQVRHLGISSG